MKFLIDAKLPPGHHAAWCHECGHEAIHVNDQPGLAFDDHGMFECARRIAHQTSSDPRVLTVRLLDRHPSSLTTLDIETQPRYNWCTSEPPRVWLLKERMRY